MTEPVEPITDAELAALIARVARGFLPTFAQCAAIFARLEQERARRRPIEPEANADYRRLTAEAQQQRTEAQKDREREYNRAESLAEENAALRAEVVRLEDCRQHLQREVADQTGRAIRNRAESNKRWQRIAALEAELVAARAERDAAVNEEREACANYDATLRCDIAPGTSQE